MCITTSYCIFLFQQFFRPARCSVITITKTQWELLISFCITEINSLFIQMKHSLRRNPTGMLLIVWSLSDSSQRLQGNSVLNTSGSVKPCSDVTLQLTFQPDGTRGTGRRTDRLQSAHCHSLQEHCQAPQQHDHTCLSSDPASACRGQHYTSLAI